VLSGGYIIEILNRDFYFTIINPSQKTRDFFLVIEGQNWADLGILSRFDTICICPKITVKPLVIRN